MNAAIVLTGKPASALKVGDLVSLEVAIDGKIGDAGDAWVLEPKSVTDWIPSGSMLISATSIQQVAAEGAISKLKMDALVQKSGALNTAPLRFRHEKDGLVVDVPQTLLGKEEIQTVQVAKDEPWLLAPVSLGGWNTFLLALLALAAAGGIFALTRWIWRRYAAHSVKKGNAMERALRELERLQRYGRGKKVEQEQWKKFSFELAFILRRYSDENFGMDSRDCTDREFLEELGRHKIKSAHAALIREILSTITEARYGTKTLEPTMAQNLLGDAKKYISESFIPEAKP